jgi:predicted dinucleotide-binding enzyme
MVGEVVDRIGYDPVFLGSLSAGRILQPGGPVFGAVLTRAEFERAIHSAAVRS